MEGLNILIHKVLLALCLACTIILHLWQSGIIDVTSHGWHLTKKSRQAYYQRSFQNPTAMNMVVFFK